MRKIATTTDGKMLVEARHDDDRIRQNREIGKGEIK